jgi:SAM-dependent methyltransferase
LLAREYRNVHVLDVSATALRVTKERLGAGANQVNCLCGDAATFGFVRHQFDIWHDRAVFHFLTDPKDRMAYVRQAGHAVKPGGHVIVATFGPEGPNTCSGLDVVRYEPGSLHGEFGTRFRLEKHFTEMHQTPAGAMQQFIYCYCNVAPAIQSQTL